MNLECGKSRKWLQIGLIGVRPAALAFLCDAPERQKRFKISSAIHRSKLVR